MNTTYRNPPRDRNSLEKPFKCDFPNCDRGYFNKKHLNRHKKQKHGAIIATSKTATDQSGGEKEGFGFSAGLEGDDDTVTAGDNTDRQQSSVAGINETLNSSKNDTDIIFTNSSVVGCSQGGDIQDTEQYADDTQFSGISDGQSTAGATAEFEFDYLMES